MAEKTAKRGVSLFLDGKEIVNSVKSISSEMKKLQNEQAKMTIGADNYIAHGQKIGYLKSLINEHVDTLKDIASEYANTTKGLDGFLNRMSQLPGAMGWIGRSLTGVGDSIDMLFKNKMMLGVSVAGALVTGFIGLVKHSMEFSKAVSELSALTGATGKDLDYLKDKAKELGGQYGKSATEIVTGMKLVGGAKPELLSNVTALADVTKEVLTLSKATGMDMTEATNDVTTIMNQFGLSALEADRTVNVLAAGSKYGAKEVDYLGESISKVGTVAKSAGLTLENTTAVMELFGEKGIRAEVAGTGFKSVLVELQSDTKNYTNGLFDLNKAIDNNQNISGDNIALQKKFGKEFFGLAQILFQNKTRFEELSKQVTGTTVAEEQMRIATDNLSGDVDKMKSSWDSFLLSIEDGKGPLANASRWLVQFGKDMVDAAASWTKSSDQKDQDLLTQNVNSRIESLKKLLPAQKDQTKYLNDEITANRHIYQNKQARMKQLQDEIRLNKELGGSWEKSNKQKTEELNGLSVEVQKSIAYVNAVGGLKNALNLKPVTKTAAAATTDTAAIQKKKVNAALKKLETDNLEQISSIKKRYLKGDIVSEYDYNEVLLDQQDKYDELRKKKLKELLKTITDPGLKLELNKQIAEIDKKALDRQIEQNNKIKKILLDADPIKSENESYNNRLRELGLFGVEKEKMTADQLDTLRILEEQHTANLSKLSTKSAIAQLKQLDKDQQDAEKLAADNRSSGELNEQQYKDKLLSIEIQFLKKKLAIQGLSADEIDKISKSLTEKLGASAEKSAQEQLTFKEKYGIDELGRFKSQKEVELKILQDYLNKGIVSEKDAYKVRRILASAEFKAKTKDFAEIASGISDVSGVFSNAIQGFQSAEEKSIETKYQKQIDAAQKAGKDTTKIEEEKNKELAAVRAKNADANFALQVAQIISSTAVAAINAYSAMSSIPLIGPVLGGIAAGAAVAYGASQIAVAESAREAAKSGYYYGGYTGGDDPNEVRGHFPDGSPYHGKEFVATHVTTANPNTKPVLDVIDEAQKNGTASSLTKADLAKAIGVSSGGYYSGGYKKADATSGLSSGSVSTNDILLGIIERNATAMDRLNTHLDKGIKAPVYISGSEGVAENLDRYYKLISNAKG